ncbi:4Fe-4S dicluster domain-containing protein [Candidatus Bathyarchaeota archaeon]|nr:4Fe-4S dicluster domain-containing protein [Candidatus Bathyarchaeota archaeon]
MSQPPTVTKIWIARDYPRCSGCRLCEIECSLKHEGKIWPEASRVRVFMQTPGVEVPHLCTQCNNYPCVNACPTKALSVDDATGAVKVDNAKCTACGICINACSGKIPHLHPDRKRIVICDLCGGDPKCAKVCTALGFNALMIYPRLPAPTYDLYAETPEKLTENLAYKNYGDKAKELI